ncbi:MAG: hypothetical protein WD795_17005 [Woeseia sp.]
MLDWLAPYGQGIALGAAIIAAFGVFLSNRHAGNEATRHRDELMTKNGELLRRADENARLQSELRSAAEKTIRQVTGEGGHGFVVPFFTQISPEIVKRDGIVIPDTVPITFGLLNNSDAPVIAPVVHISQRVPIGEGIEGSNMQILFSGRIGDVFPQMGPTMINAKSTIKKAQDNWFNVVIFSRAATFSQSIVVTWNGDLWVNDYELRQLKDTDRNVEEKTLHSIRVDFPFLDERRQ